MSEALLDPLEAHLDRAELRLARLASHEAVERLQRAYGYYVDKGLWSAAADLFADDGTWEWGQSGVYRGRERIRAALARGLPEDEIATRSAAGSSLLGERDIRRIQSALEVYLEEHNSLDLLIGASGRRVVISTTGDPSQDAELVINR